MLSFVLALGLGSLFEQDKAKASPELAVECTSYEIAAAEETPSIFTESNCMGSVKLPPKPTPIPIYPPGGGGPIVVGPPPLVGPPPSNCVAGAPSRQVPVSSSSSLASALSNAECGDEIVVANGNYNGNFTLNAKCSNKLPVIVKAANTMGPVITSKLSVLGDCNAVIGMLFDGRETGVRLGGNGNQIVRNRFRGWGGIGISVQQGKGAEIGHNEFSEPYPWQASEVGSYPLRIAIRTAEKTPAEFHYNAWVHHNYFHDFPAKPGSYHTGQDDAIEVCQTWRPPYINLRTGWLVEYNLIERHLQGSGVMDFKCGGSTVQFNTMINSPGGRIDNRGGPYGSYIANWIENSGGMGIHSGFHKIIGNKITGGGKLYLAAGTENWNETGGGGATRQLAFQCLVAGNDAPLTVGNDYGPETLPAESNVIEGHKGAIQLDLERNTTVRPTSSVTVPAARRLTPGEVGIYAP